MSAPSSCDRQLFPRVYRRPENRDHCGSVGFVFSRRVLFVAAAGLAASVAGCAVTPPGPAPSPSPSGTPDPAHAALAGVHAALASAYAVEPDAARLGLLGWALDVVSEQADAVGTSLPAVPSRTPTPPTPATPPPASAWPPPAVTAALASAQGAYREHAVSPATAQPLVWAAMAAWSAALVPALGRPQGPREERRDRLAPPVQTVAEAAQAALTASEEALYGVQLAGGAGELDADALARIRARVTLWQRLRDDLRVAAGPALSPSPTPAAPWFAGTRPADAAAAFALVARVQSAALPILGRSLAFGTDPVRVRLVPALADLAGDTPAWGGPLLRWPGWPAA